MSALRYGPKLWVDQGRDLREGLGQKRDEAGPGWLVLANRAGRLLHAVHGPTGVLIRIQGEFHNSDATCRNFLIAVRSALRDLPKTRR